MAKSSKKIIVRRAAPESTTLSAKGLHPLLHQIYAARGVQSTVELERNLTHLLPYQGLLGIEQAVACLSAAVQQQQNILIIGDFDADGATSTAVAVSVLRTLGAQHVNFLVPNRFDFGYGLTPEIVEVAVTQFQPQVIITVDNGISSHAGVLAAKAHGIKVVVTDHHLSSGILPSADAIVNPNQPGCTFASKNLAGVGVIFYVMLALRSQLRDAGWFKQLGLADPNMAQFLDLVALGTVADLVPLDRNNRILVHQGLQRIRNGKARPGIQALLNIAGRTNERLVTADLGFAVGPRLNAAGRLTDMSIGIECLLSDDVSVAQKLAAQLDALNKERRVIEFDMQQQALEELKKIGQLDNEKTNLPLGVCLFDESWHQGVIGLIASRVKEQLHRPTIIFAPANERELKGSARSIPGLHIRDVLAAVAARYPQMLDKFGGHAMAAGLTLKREDYPQFCQAFAAEVANNLSPDDLRGVIYSDGALKSGDFSLELATQLRAGGPWGQAFPEPIFDGRFKVNQQWIVGGRHLKLMLQLDNAIQHLEAIAFNVDVECWPNHRLEYIQAAYRLDINEYQGRRTLQIIIDQLEPA